MSAPLPLRRRRPLEGVLIMCAKYQRRCPTLLAIREQAVPEWIVAETFEDVQNCWRRLGGLTTLHRYGPEHFRRMAQVRWSR